MHSSYSIAVFTDCQKFLFLNSLILFVSTLFSVSKVLIFVFIVRIPVMLPLLFQCITNIRSGSDFNLLFLVISFGL